MAVLGISHIMHSLSFQLYSSSSSYSYFIITRIYKDGLHLYPGFVYYCTHALIVLRYSARYGLSSAEGPIVISRISNPVSTEINMWITHD